MSRSLESAHWRDAAPVGAPVRVAHLLHTVAHGGVETALLNWVRAFRTDRIAVRLVCFQNPDRSEQPFVKAAEKYGVQTDFMPWSRWKPVLGAARRMADYVKSHRIEILHCHNTYANVVGLLTARLVPVRTVTTLYVWGDFGFKRNILQYIDQRTLRYFDQVTAHCEACFHDTVKRGYPAADLQLLTCGYPADRVVLSPSDRDRRRADLGCGPGDTAVVYLARFWPEKAHDNLLDAFRCVLDFYPSVYLWLPGVGPELDRIRQKARDLGLDTHVRFLGFYEDFMGLLALADIQVHPSDNEGVPLAVLAGMAAGKPLITTPVGGLTEILRDKTSAIFVPKRNPAATADAIVELMRRPERGKALGAAARSFIENEYSLQRAAERVEALYSRLVNRCGSAFSC